MRNCSFVHRRKGLKAALAGREVKSLSAVLRFLIRYIGDYRFTRTLIDVANVLLGKELQEGACGETRD
jgi:U3 small nucleolar RNA-associated protein 15